VTDSAAVSDPTAAKRAARHQPAPTTSGGGTERLYFRQLLAGREFSVGDPVARQMMNFVYLLGDRQTGEAVIVDPAYGVDDLVDLLEADGMRCVGALVTHYHPDHVGGDLMGTPIEGITRLLDRVAVPIHVQADEAPWVERVTGVGAGDLTRHGGGDVVQVGEVPVTLVHTPGHTPGSQCFLSTDGWCRETRCSSTAVGGPTFRGATRRPCTSR